jgi:NDP-sugar pyrophosphorylase family protein
MEENKKYELVEDDSIIYKGRKLYRIKALRYFNAGGKFSIHRGDIGGYVEGYHNLSQEGECWIFDNAKVYSNAVVKNSAIVFNKAEVFGNAVVKGYARVIGSKIYGNAVIRSNANVKEGVKIYGNAKIEESVVLYNSEIYGNAIVKGTMTVSKMAKIHDNAAVIISNTNRTLFSYCRVEGADICDNAEVKGQEGTIILDNKISNNSIIYHDGRK